MNYLLSIVPHPITITLRHPGTGLPVGVIIECVSLDDDRCKAVDRAYREKFARLTSPPSPEQVDKHIDERNKAVLAASMVTWVWDADWALEEGGDMNPPPTTENKLKLLSLVWAAKQIDTKLGDEAAFFQTSNDG